MHPDATLYHEAQSAEARLRASAARVAKRTEWEAVVLRYRKVVARFPRSGYCDDALLAVGNLYREMATRFHSPRYREDALVAYRTLVAEYPSSRLGDDALWASAELAREAGDRRRIADAARAYLDAYPEGERASRAKKLLREGEPASPLPSPPPRGLARVFDLRSWSGDSSTRVVIDLERKVKLESDRATNPDRLWVDLQGTRLHPNLARRVFPVGDGLLEQVRIAQNRDDVVRVVLDFKEVREHQIFYLDDPTRLVIDVQGEKPPAQRLAQAPPAPTGPAGAPVPALPTRRVDGMVARGNGRGAGSARTAAEPLTIAGVDRLPTSPRPASPRPAPAAPAPAPEPPATNRTGSYSLARQLGLGARRIVIDAGHGGHDPGTTGHGGLEEKDLVLDVALRLDRLVRQDLGADVILTRSTDVFIPLEERTAIANSRGADLFLSIHANSSRNARARGIETYFLNFAQDPHAEAVAARENAISAATLKDLQNLVRAITLNSKIDESREFASAVQEGMVAGVRSQNAVPDRGVHTAPFYVLIGANMPAVLAEIAFVSNPEDEKRLKSPEYREVLAQSLLRGVRSYLEALNRTQMRQLTDAARRSTVAKERGGR
ncbi:MAG TPA: N-acetylmuramoyl-L-alanine amidase [Vicinamibacteria bacterium]|nr:N-acetylmuramoyl-L-alanine amidase [Vicinamibacteria bacterium]